MLVIKQQMLINQISFLVSMLGLKQMLIYQISLVESWSRATDANNSNFIWSASW
jgi:hypothetical protein